MLSKLFFGPAGRVADSTRIVELIRTRHLAGVWGKLLIEDGASIRAAVTHLVGIGRQRIGFIGANPTMSSGRGRVAANEAALHSHGLASAPCLIKTGAPGFAMGQERMDDLLSLAAPPDALICGWFEISNGALDTCLRRGVTFPGDLELVGYGDPISYQWIRQGISTIEVSPEDLAQRATGMLGATDIATKGMISYSPTQLVLRDSARA